MWLKQLAGLGVVVVACKHSKHQVTGRFSSPPDDHCSLHPSHLFISPSFPHLFIPPSFPHLYIPPSFPPSIRTSSYQLFLKPQSEPLQPPDVEKHDSFLLQCHWRQMKVRRSAPTPWRPTGGGCLRTAELWLPTGSLLGKCVSGLETRWAPSPEVCFGHVWESRLHLHLFLHRPWKTNERVGSDLVEAPPPGWVTDHWPSRRSVTVACLR